MKMQGRKRGHQDPQHSDAKVIIGELQMVKWV